MRLGVSGVIIPHRLDEVSAEAVAAVRTAGFSGFATRFWDDPRTVSSERARQVGQLFADGGLTVTQATGYWQPLIHPEAKARAQAVSVLQEAIRVAAALGAAAVLTGPGTLNPRFAALPDDQRRTGAWWPDRHNHGPVAVERLVASLREAVKAADDQGILISLECHVISTLESPECVRQVVEAVGSPRLAVNIDPVNFVDTVPRYYANTGRLNEIFDLLDPYIVSGDAKDILLDDPVVVHLKETPAGEGTLDYATFLRRFERVCPDGFLHLEHFPLPEALRGQLFIRQQAAALGITIHE